MFAAIDCAGLQPYLVESLLWGHGGLLGSDRVGTVYLKEPSALPLDLQFRLAEAFAAEKPDGPRLISGSTAAAAEGVRAGRLRREFDTDLSIVEIRVPPLRERFEDLARLAGDFLERHGSRAALDAATLEVLKSQSWPGNLRELADVLVAAAAPAGDGPIKREHLPHAVRVKAGLARPAPEPSLKLDATLETVEKRLIRLALDKAGGNATRAAELLGIWRTRLLRRMEALGLGKGEGEA
jgi:DNA-binding NtrC family response regulator